MLVKLTPDRDVIYEWPLRIKWDHHKCWPPQWSSSYRTLKWSINSWNIFLSLSFFIWILTNVIAIIYIEEKCCFICLHCHYYQEKHCKFQNFLWKLPYFFSHLHQPYGVDFTNISRAAFTQADPKSVNIQSSCQYFLSFWDLRV